MCYSTLYPAVPSIDLQHHIHPLPPKTESSELIDSNPMSRSRKNKDSLLISRPSFIGDFETLTAYYQSQTENHKQSQPEIPSLPSMSVTVKSSDLDSNRMAGQPGYILISQNTTQNGLSLRPELIETKGDFAEKNQSLGGDRSSTKASTEAELLKPKVRAVHSLHSQAPRSTIVTVSEPDVLSSSASPPKLNLPFIGTGRHIGCRFSVNTLTREVDRALGNEKPSVS